MNTKHTRVVVTLFLAVATLATMGFSTAHEERRAPDTPDHVTCEQAVIVHSAVELLEYVDQPCHAELMDRIETDLGPGFSNNASAEALLESVWERSRATNFVPVELLASRSGVTVGNGRVVISVSPGAWYVTDVAPWQADRLASGGRSTVGNGRAVASVSPGTWYVTDVAPWPVELFASGGGTTIGNGRIVASVSRGAWYVTEVNVAPWPVELFASGGGSTIVRNGRAVGRISPGAWYVTEVDVAP